MNYISSVISWVHSPIPQRRRRVLLLAVVAGLLASLAWTWLVGGVVPLVLLMLWLGLLVRLNRSTLRLVDQPEGRLDERQLESRNHYYQRSHRGMVALGGLLLFIAVAIVDASPGGALLAVADPAAVLNYATSTYVLLLLMLPLAVAVWSEPNEARDEAPLGFKRQRPHRI